MRTLRRTVPGPRTGGDEGAAMMFVILTMFIATSISLLLLGTIVSQVGPAQFAQKNVRTAHAAEAGIDIALGQIRSASAVDPLDSTKTVGSRSKLPCVAGTKTGRLSGDIGVSPGELTYDVTIRYYYDDPAGKTDAWRTTNAMACTTGGGPALTPRYALLQSVGAGRAVPRRNAADGNRTLETVYDFQLTNANVSGGLIHNYWDGNAASFDLCWDATTEAPPAGTRVRMQLCVPEEPKQLWSWRKDFTIALSTTLNPANGGVPMCATAVGTTDPRQIQLQVCGTGFEQKWGYSDSGRFRARLDGLSYNSYCPIVTTDNTPGSFLDASTAACGGATRQTQWRPESRAGAGSVGDVTGSFANTPFQWVNYFEFGRCFDISNWNTGSASMIAYPCKQDPISAVGWNQTLVWDDVTGQLFTRTSSAGNTYAHSVSVNGPKYCVQAPAANRGYVTMVLCATSGIPANQKWVVNRDVGDYSGSYTMVDSAGRCLAVGAPNPAVYLAWSSIVSETCDGSGRQKWNAPPNGAPSIIRDTRELTAP